jgi:hypothetical protein
LARKTNERAEIDKRRIVNAGGIFWNQSPGALPELFPASGSIDRAVKIKQARQNARSVGFNNRNWLIKGERGDGIGRVTTDTGQCTGCREIARKSASMEMLDRFRNRMQIASSRVIAEALPRVEDVTFRSLGQGGEIGEAAEPLIIIRDNDGNLSLLEHELGDEDGIGIASLAPGEETTMAAIPIRQRAMKALFLESHKPKCK